MPPLSIKYVSYSLCLSVTCYNGSQNNPSHCQNDCHRHSRNHRQNPAYWTGYFRESNGHRPFHDRASPTATENQSVYKPEVATHDKSGTSGNRGPDRTLCQSNLRLSTDRPSTTTALSSKSASTGVTHGRSAPKSASKDDRLQCLSSKTRCATTQPVFAVSSHQ